MASDEHDIIERKGERRADGDRRHAEKPHAGPERRSFERRRSIERRGLPFGIFYKTDESLNVIYDWLHGNCRGKWGIGIEPLAGDATGKAVKVLFEIEAEKTAFMEQVVRG